MCLADNFVKYEIPRLKKLNALKCGLVDYVPVPSAFEHDPYCHKIATTIISDLAYGDCLRDGNHRWLTPQDGFILPGKFLHNGTPFFSEEDIKRCLGGSLTYLAPEYSTPDRLRALHPLGCQTFRLEHITKRW